MLLQIILHVSVCVFVFECTNRDTCQVVSFTLGADDNTVCRESSGPCDAPEYCHGSVATCPADVALANGVRIRTAFRVLVFLFSRLLL